MVKNLVAVAVGGAVGTTLRIAAEELGGLGFTTLVVNILGSFVLGLLVAGMWKKPTTPEWLKVAVGPGLLGSFTTLSGLMLYSLVADTPTQAVVIIFIGLVTSLLAALGGIALGAKLGRSHG